MDMRTRTEESPADQATIICRLSPSIDLDPAKSLAASSLDGFVAFRLLVEL